MAEPLKFSVILPVYHGGQPLAEALGSLASLDTPPEDFEVLVAGPAGDTDSAAITESQARRAACPVRYVSCPRAWRSAELNEACSQAQGKLLAFTDDDCVLPPNWLVAAERALRSDEDVGMVGGPDEHIPQEDVFGLTHDWVLNSFVGTAGCRKGKGVSLGAYYPRLSNMAVTRRVADQVAVRNGDGAGHIFDESLSVHENVDLARRVLATGRRIVYEPAMVVRHHRLSSFGHFIARNFRMARAARRLGVHALPHVILSAALVAAALLAVLGFFYPPAALGLAAAAGLYLVVLFAGGLGAAAATGKMQSFVVAPALLASVHVSRAVGYLLPGRTLLPGEREDHHHETQVRDAAQ
jgi:GT2 family glycosyltransferase